MTVAELQSRLALVNAAIDYVLTGNAQSAQRAGRSLTTLPLDKLERLRKTYEWELACAQGTAGQPVEVRFKEPKGAGVTAYDPMYQDWGPMI